MAEFLSLYKDIVIGLVFVLLSIVVIYLKWEKVKFWLLNINYSFPIVGKTKKLAKKIDGIEEGTGWLNSEETLCHDYYVHYNKVDRDADFFDSCKSYISRATETGRHPMPIFIGILIVALVFVESLGFSYVLAGFTIPGASEEVQQYGSYGIAFLISAILVVLTHQTGHELYFNSVKKKVRDWYNMSNDEGNLERGEEEVTLERNHLDDKSPKHIKALNRVNADARVTQSHTMTIITIVVVVLVAIGATYVRGQVLEKMLLETTTISSEIVEDSSDPFGGSFPTEMTDTQKIANDKAAVEMIDADKKGGWATFIVLAVIFVFLQIIGVIFGHKWGFVGRESKEAYRYIKGFNTRNEFYNFYKNEKSHIARVAQQKLATLQQLMGENIASMGISKEKKAMIKNRENRKFIDFVDLQKEMDGNY